MDDVGCFSGSVTLRATNQLVKLGRLAVAMDATSLVADGVPRGCFPYLRERHPEKRKPGRRRTTGWRPTVPAGAVAGAVVGSFARHAAACSGLPHSSKNSARTLIDSRSWLPPPKSLR